MLYTVNAFIIFSQVMHHEVANHKIYLPVLEKELENNPFIKNILSSPQKNIYQCQYTIWETTETIIIIMTSGCILFSSWNMVVFVFLIEK